MSALGQKQTYAVQNVMSALPPKADMCSPTISCSVANIPFLLYTFVAVDFNARSNVKPCSKVDY